jgi:hypothetical protein
LDLSLPLLYRKQYARHQQQHQYFLHKESKERQNWMKLRWRVKVKEGKREVYGPEVMILSRRRQGIIRLTSIHDIRGEKAMAGASHEKVKWLPSSFALLCYWLSTKFPPDRLLSSLPPSLLMMVGRRLSWMSPHLPLVVSIQGKTYMKRNEDEGKGDR